MTLRYSRRSFRRVVWKSGQDAWARLHEEAWRYFGGACRYVVLDNLKEGVIKPDLYEPELNAVYGATLARYGVVADPARVGDLNRKGTVENAIGHTLSTALKGRRFESIAEQNEYLEHWETKWAAPRIHGSVPATHLSNTRQRCEPRASNINREDEMAMTREQMQSCMEQVAQYRASGQKAQAWADAHGLSRQTLVAWCTHVQRWQARLDGVSVKPTTTAKPSGFVAARVAPGTASNSVRLELNAGGTRIDLHWPLTHTRELATLVRELSR